MGSLPHSPILIVGVGRSGTTALFNGLVRHPDVLAARGELPFLSSLAPLIDHIESATDREWFFGSLAISHDDLHRRLRRLIFATSVGRFRGLRSRLHHVRRGDTRAFFKSHWCGKTYLDAQGFRGLRVLYPRMRLLYVLRNGAEVVESRRHFPGFAGRDFADHCKEWAHGVDRYRYLADRDEAIELRHEHLLLSPAQEFARAYEHTGLRPSPRPAAWARETLVHPRANPTRRRVNVQEVLSSRPPAHELWSSEEREIFERTCGPAMDEVGYPMPY